MLKSPEHTIRESCVVTASDPYGEKATATVTVTLADEPPTAERQTIEFHRGPVAIELIGSDPDDVNLGYAIISSPLHGTLSGTPPNLSYMPDASFLKGGNEDSFLFSVTDGVLADQATVKLVVVNASPTAEPDTGTTYVEQPVTIPVLLNDSDPDGDSLSVTSVTNPAHGTVAITGEGITYTPEAHFCGSDAFSYTISDGYGGEATGNVTVTVVDNVPPQVKTKAFTAYLDENGRATITPQDVDDGSTDNCGIASMSVSPDSFTCADLGPNTVTLTVTDTSENQASASATVTVADNLPPTLTVPADITIECGQSTDPANTGQATAIDNCDSAPEVTYSDTASGSCPEVITRTWTATDASGNSTTGVQQIMVEDTTPPSVTVPNGITVDTHDPTGALVAFTVTATDACDPNPTVTCTPASGSMFSLGTTTVTCSATDTCGNTSSPVQFTVTVNYVNHAPNAQADTVTTDEDTSVTIPVLANDSDPDGDTLSVTNVTTPGHGTAVINGDEVVYTPDSGYVGTDTFSYTIADPDGATDSAAVSVTVEAVNHPPVAFNQSVTVHVGVPQTITLQATDPDGDPLTYTIVDGPEWGAIESVNFPNITYVAGSKGEYDHISFKVNDGKADSNIATVTIWQDP